MGIITDARKSSDLHIRIFSDKSLRSDSMDYDLFWMPMILGRHAHLPEQQQDREELKYGVTTHHEQNRVPGSKDTDGQAPVHIPRDTL